MSVGSFFLMSGGVGGGYFFSNLHLLEIGGNYGKICLVERNF